MPKRETPYRSPIAISDTIREIIAGRVVCDLGCGEGDNIVFMSRYAKKVFGIEHDVNRYSHALAQGCEVTVGNYLECEIPEADVYYVWPNNPFDSHTLSEKFINAGRRCTLIVAADVSWGNELQVVKELVSKYKGCSIEVSYNEGTGWRQSGKFVLGVLDFGV